MLQISVIGVQQCRDIQACYMSIKKSKRVLRKERHAQFISELFVQFYNRDKTLTAVILISRIKKLKWCESLELGIKTTLNVI